MFVARILLIICFYEFFIVSDQTLIQLDDYNEDEDGNRLKSERDSEDYADYKDIKDYDFKEDLYQKAIFNVTVNFIVPMVSLRVPKYSSSGNPLDLVYQVMFAGFGILAATVYIGLPSLMATIMKTQDYLYEYEPDLDASARVLTKRSAHDSEFVDHVGVNHAYFIDKVGLDWRKCLQKTICQAHEQNAGHRYGLLGVPFQILFPEPASNSSALSQSEYRQAAANGARNAINCNELYKCFFDVLDLGIQITDMYGGLEVHNNLCE